jgi:hypothetical protein
MGRPINNITGLRFSRLVVLERAENTKAGNVIWRCRCDCGGETKAQGAHLRAGSTVSCGCYRRERVTKHGMRYSKLYAVWCAMLARCYSPARKDYKWYGAKGTYVSADWHEFPAFAAWASNSGYQGGLTIERKDVEGHYHPENCCWIPLREQNSNKRKAVRWRHGTMTGYANHKCRCEPCREANAAAGRNQRKRRAALKAEARGDGK